MSQCAERGCSFFATPGLSVCSRHTPEAKERAIREAATVAAASAAAAAAAEPILQQAAEWAAYFSRPEMTEDERPRHYLVLGATPFEERRGRTHYDREDVFLLSYEPIPLHISPGIDVRRYIQADYSADRTNQLEELLVEHENEFNEIAFDQSCMCPFYGSTPESLQARFGVFYGLLKPNGVFFLPDIPEGTEDALRTIGFDVGHVRARDLAGYTLPNHLYPNLIANPDRIILVAIKRDPYSGGKRKNTRRRRGRGRGRGRGRARRFSRKTREQEQEQRRRQRQ